MNSRVANAVDHLLDEVDQEEAAAEEDLGCGNPSEVVPGAFNAFSNLENINIINNFNLKGFKFKFGRLVLFFKVTLISILVHLKLIR